MKFGRDLAKNFFRGKNLLAWRFLQSFCSCNKDPGPNSCPVKASATQKILFIYKDILTSLDRVLSYSALNKSIGYQIKKKFFLGT